MYQYRVFIKDCLDLTGMAIANVVCVSFDLSKDLLTSATSSFETLEEIGNAKIGDILGLIDPYGTILYEGVIESLSGTSITCKELLSIFNDNWLWHDTSDTTIEGKLASIITDDFINSSDSLIASKYPYEIVVQSNTVGTLEQKEANTVMNFESLINELYNTYGVIVDINIPFNANKPTITLKQATTPSFKIGNNNHAIRNLTPLTEVVETNKLVIYTKATEETPSELRGTYYATTSGITTNDENPLRLPTVKTKFIFDDETPLEDLVQENLTDEMFNHKITFDMLIDNHLYEFNKFELGQELSIWYGTSYFSTIFTGYRMNKASGQALHTVSVVCGKVRNKLTEVLNGK